MNYLNKNCIKIVSFIIFSGILFSSCVSTDTKAADTIPPEMNLMEPAEGTVISDETNFKIEVVDTIGIDEFIIRLDGEKETQVSSKKPTRLENLFTNFSYEEGIVSFYVNSRKISNGSHSLDIEVKDKKKKKSMVSFAISVNNDNLFSNCDNIDDWTFYVGGGSSFKMESDTGVKGNAVKVNYSGASSGYWGLFYPCQKDFTEITEIQFSLKGSSKPLRVQLHDGGNTLWTTYVEVSEDWEKVTIPISEFKFRRDYQHSRAKRNKEINLERIMNFQLLQSDRSLTAKGEFWVDEVYIK